MSEVTAEDKEGLRSPGTGGTGRSELLGLGVGNWTQASATAVCALNHWVISADQDPVFICRNDRRVSLCVHTLYVLA